MLILCYEDKTVTIRHHAVDMYICKRFYKYSSKNRHNQKANVDDTYLEQNNPFHVDGNMYLFSASKRDCATVEVESIVLLPDRLCHDPSIPIHYEYSLQISVKFASMAHQRNWSLLLPDRSFINCHVFVLPWSIGFHMEKNAKAKTCTCLSHLGIANDKDQSPLPNPFVA